MPNSSKQQVQAISPSSPLTPELSRASHFGPPIVLEGENEAAYNELYAAVSAKLKPADIFEEMWTHDIVDLIWEHQRWRRLRESYINSEVPADLTKILNPLIDYDALHPGRSFTGRVGRAAAKLDNVAGEDLVRRWVAGEAGAIAQVNDLLATAKMSMDSVVARTAARLLDTIAGYNRLISSAEWRRDTLLREIGRRRASFAQLARDELGDAGATTKMKMIDAPAEQTSEVAA
jgi:hypothetical protein